MRAYLVVISLAILVGCSQDSTPKTEPVKPPAVDSTPVESTSNTTKDAAPEPKPKWMIQVEGMPTLSGSVVLTSKIGATKYSLMGSEALAFFDIMNKADTEPYIANIGFPRTRTNCVYRADNHQTSTGLRLSMDGKRYLVEGEITCATPNTEGTSHSISGYFTPK